MKEKKFTTSDLAKFAIHLLNPHKCRDQFYGILNTEHQSVRDFTKEILTEYAHLFLGTGASTHSLRASTWLNPPGYLYPTTISEIQSFYRQSQLTLQATTRDADHLGLMLIFISLLLDHHDVNYARVFYNGYVRPWLPKLICQIRKAQSKYYAPLLKILHRELNNTLS